MKNILILLIAIGIIHQSTLAQTSEIIIGEVIEHYKNPDQFNCRLTYSYFMSGNDSPDTKMTGNYYENGRQLLFESDQLIFVSDSNKELIIDISTKQMMIKLHESSGFGDMSIAKILEQLNRYEKEIISDSLGFKIIFKQGSNFNLITEAMVEISNSKKINKIILIYDEVLLDKNKLAIDHPRLELIYSYEDQLNIFPNSKLDIENYLNKIEGNYYPKAPYETFEIFVY